VVKEHHYIGASQSNQRQTALEKYVCPCCFELGTSKKKNLYTSCQLLMAELYKHLVKSTYNQLLFNVSSHPLWCQLPNQRSQAVGNLGIDWLAIMSTHTLTQQMSIVETVKQWFQ